MEDSFVYDKVKSFTRLLHLYYIYLIGCNFTLLKWSVWTQLSTPKTERPEPLQAPSLCLPLPGPTLISSDLDHIIEPFVKGDTMRISCDIVQLQYSERAHGSGGFGTNDLIIVSSTILYVHCY